MRMLAQRAVKAKRWRVVGGVTWLKKQIPRAKFALGIAGSARFLRERV